MFESLTPDALRAIHYAHSEATSFGFEMVNAVSLLVGLARLSDESTHRLLPCTMEEARATAAALTSRQFEPAEAPLNPVFSFDSSAKHVLALAASLASETASGEITPNHMVTALRTMKDKTIEEMIARLSISTLEKPFVPDALSGPTDKATLQRKIQAWERRAEMARASGQEDLVERALIYKAQEEDKLKKLLEEE